MPSRRKVCISYKPRFLTIVKDAGLDVDCRNCRIKQDTPSMARCPGWQLGCSHTIQVRSWSTKVRKAAECRAYLQSRSDALCCTPYTPRLKKPLRFCNPPHSLPGPHIVSGVRLNRTRFFGFATGMSMGFVRPSSAWRGSELPALSASRASSVSSCMLQTSGLGSRQECSSNREPETFLGNDGRIGGREAKL
jgi:hypothetical protein